MSLMATTSGKSVYRVAVGGAGYVSASHLRALRSIDNVEVVGIMDPDPGKAHQAASVFRIPHVFRSIEEVGVARPDVVHVLTPPSSHCSVTLQALEMGCH